MIDLSNTVITLNNYNNNIDSLFYSTNLNGGITQQHQHNNIFFKDNSKLSSSINNNLMPNIFMSSNNNNNNNLIDYDPQPQLYSYSNDVNKAFDDVVFDILKVDPDEIAGQLTLIDVPLFKAIEPDELISCKWMSREKLIKAPNIVHFTRRFNQTTFWCQKEILNCKKIEKRGKMITHFIKIAKRLNELHSFNSLMAIIVALKSAPIYRLKKTWSQHVSKRDSTCFERLADLMFDTSDNKRKIRDMHMNCKLPCIPFLGLFLTDLIHIDIAHPHNSFDNPQRRNQMNNICRLISEYQQSNYQDLTSFSCSCIVTNTNLVNSDMDTCNTNGGNSNNCSNNGGSEVVCSLSNCSCAIHHGNGYGGGVINNDGTIYISEIQYVKNYLNSFLYIEELQKFKEDENYRDSLELEPDPTSASTTNSNTNNSNNNHTDNLKCAPDLSLTPSISSPNRLFMSKTPHHPHLSSYTSASVVAPGTDVNSNNNGSNTNFLQHRKTMSLATSLFNQQDHQSNQMDLITETKDLINQLKHHPLDDSIVVEPSAASSTIATITLAPNPININTDNTNILDSNLTNNLLTSNNNTNQITSLNELPNLNLNLNLSKEQQKKLLSSVKLNDPPSLLKELLKHRHNSVNYGSSSSNKHHHSNRVAKFSCYSANTADLDDDDSDNSDSNLNNNNNNNVNIPVVIDQNGINSTVKSLNNNNNNLRRLSGRNLAKSLDREDNSVNNNNSDCLDGSTNSNNNNNNSIKSTIDIDTNLLTASLIQFESPVKRKCIIKNYRKPRFSQWKSYWLQLVGGNLLIYYPSKKIYFNKADDPNASNSRRNSNLPNDIPQQPPTQELLSQQQYRKVNFHKNPVKMHPIANWMVVCLFQDKENEILAAQQQQQQQQQNQQPSQSTLSSNSTPIPEHTKFDIQLNDLNNGNMYKYRFDSLQLAKEWLEQFKLASTYHERQRPDNLIRFD